MDSRPIVGVTIGDPAGVGPEVVAKALAKKEIRQSARLLVIGNMDAVRKAVEMAGDGKPCRLVSSPAEGSFSMDATDVLDPTSLDFSSLRPGEAQAEAGQASFDQVRQAIELAMSGEIDAIATAPINKEALRAARVPYIDHTAMLAGLSGSPDPMTLFMLDKMKIFFLTRHVPLSQVAELITTERVLEALRRIGPELRRLGIENPSIAVAGLNPHSSDGGLFGPEEAREIAPAVALAREEGIDAHGPIAADSVFFLNRRGTFDSVLSLYHDQGHIASKTVDFERTVSVTVGIPFLRTSVDHGTAFDIAWKGVASAVGMEESILVAARHARAFRQTTN